jgi:nucleolar complex protein 3
VKKDKAADRGTIPIPSANDDNVDVDVSDQDLAVLAEFGESVNFLNKLDRNGIMRYSFLFSSV